MKILILNGSPKKSGNTAFLCEAFKEGAEEAGHEVELIHVGGMNIKACLGCNYCRGKGNGKCVQQDNMQELYPKLAEADMVVLASAVHYWGFTGQLQSAITRFYSLGKPAAKKYALLLSSASPEVYEGILWQYKEILSWFGAESLGEKLVCDPDNKTPETYEAVKAFGKSVC